MAIILINQNYRDVDCIYTGVDATTMFDLFASFHRVFSPIVDHLNLVSYSIFNFNFHHVKETGRIPTRE